jgi:hypothetical protein
MPIILTEAPAKSVEENILPLGLGGRNSGAIVPSGGIVDSSATDLPLVARQCSATSLQVAQIKCCLDGSFVWQSDLDRCFARAELPMIEAQ